MRKLSLLLIGLLAVAQVQAGALLDIVTKGSTDRSVSLSIIDSTDGTPENAVVYNTSGIDLWYRREGAARTAVTEVTLAALTTAHTDGGFLYVSDGEYRLDLPDAAFATGANYVDIGGTVTGMVVIGGRVRLVDYSLEDSVRGTTGTALPNAVAGASGGVLISGTNAGTTTLGALTITGTTTHTGATTFTGAITGSNASNNLRINGAVPGASGGLFIAGTNAATSVTTALTANITGNLSGSVGSVSGAVGSVTGAVGSVSGAVGSVASGGISEASFATTAGSFKPLGIIDQGTAQAYTAGTPSLTLRSAATFGDNTLAGVTILICGSTQGYCQPATAASNVGSTDVVTLNAALPVAASGTITYYAFGTATSSGGSGLDAAGVRAAVGLASANLDTQIAAVQSDTDNIQTRIPAALVSGRMDASVGAMAANTMTAAAAASDLTTELQSGLATSSALTTVSGKIDVIDDFLDTEIAAILVDTGTTLDGKLDTIDTVVDAIKAKTDSLTFTKAGEVDANMQSINGATMTGDGSGSPFDVAP